MQSMEPCVDEGSVVTYPLLISFANSLDPDQVMQLVGPDLDPKLFDTQIVIS